MIKKTKIFLWSSFIGLIILCIIMFVFAAVTMSGKSNDAIGQVGTLYMSEMSKQIKQKFDALINPRIMQLKEIVENNPVDSLIDDEEKVYELSRSARVRSFDFLGLYTEDGDYETVYGKAVQPYYQETFERVLEDKEKRVFSGYNEDGDKMLLVMIDAEYPMAGGGTSSAIVAGFSMEYLYNGLALDDENDLMYSHVIRRDGTFVIRDIEGDYFTRIAEQFTEVDGKTAEQYARELQEAIENDDDYSATVKADGSYQHILCTHLPDSDWYLVSVLPFGVLDETVNNLSTQRQLVILLACGVVLIGVLIIFALYYRVSQKQLKELDMVSKEAVHASRAKSDFLSNMSHDIRTPMNAIVGMTVIAEANIEDTNRVQDCLSKISAASKHLLGLINDILDMSRIESGRMQLDETECNLEEVMHDLKNIIQTDIHSKQLELLIDTVDVLDEDVYCDKLRLNQIFLNLLGNAMKFTNPGGTVSVRIIQKKDAPVGYGAYEFRIKDTGIGMSPEFLENIFEPFERERNSTVSKIPGTGLGMPITKSIVDMMGGTITVTSEQGKGTEFVINLQFRLQNAPRKVEKIPLLEGMRALVVDDDFNTCDSVTNMLIQIGMRAEWTMSGKEAVLRTRQLSETIPIMCIFLTG